MVVIITRTLVTTAVTPDEDIIHRRPLFRGQRLQVDPVFDECEEFDWLAPVGGGLIAVPPDAWARDLCPASMN